MKYKILLALFFVLGLVSCRKEMPDMQNPREELVCNWDQLFESYWNGMNYNYVFWDIDTTDWDKIYEVYKPKFEGIAKAGFKNEEVNREAFEWLKEMSSTLIDYHFRISVNLTPSDGNSYTYIPSDENIRKRKGYHENFFLSRNSILQKMVNDGRFVNIESCPIDLQTPDQRYYISGITKSNILYLGFSSFSIQADLKNENYKERMEAVFNIYWNNLDNNPDLKGVIIDVRGNGGGSLSDLSSVLGRFVKEPLKVFYTRKKSGTGRLDYTPYTPEYLYPLDYKRELDIPVVVLADMHSVSMAEMTTMAVLALPKGNGVFIGEQTWGGTGNLSPYFDMTYGGQFINTMLDVYTCMSNLVDANGVSHEGKGIKPTIEVPLDVEALLQQHTDNQLEYAINYILSGQKTKH